MNHSRIRSPITSSTRIRGETTPSTSDNVTRLLRQFPVVKDPDDENGAVHLPVESVLNWIEYVVFDESGGYATPYNVVDGAKDAAGLGIGDGAATNGPSAIGVSELFGINSVVTFAEFSESPKMRSPELVGTPVAPGIGKINLGPTKARSGHRIPLSFEAHALSTRAAAAIPKTTLPKE